MTEQQGGSDSTGALSTDAGYDPADAELIDDDELDEDELDEDGIDDEDLGVPAGAEPGGTTRADDPDIIVAEVVDVAPSLEPDAGLPPVAAQTAMPAVGQQAGTPDAAVEADAGQLSPQWHDIQAMFVDDPGAAVRLAAQAAEAAVSAVVSTLERQQAALPRPDAEQSPAADTEQLRAALREFRAFSQSMDDLAAQLPSPGPARQPAS